MTGTTPTPMPRWRLLTFWVLLVLLLLLHLGERPEQLGYLITAFGGFPQGAGATHEMHWFAQGVFAWVMVAAVTVQLRRPAAQVGAAWVFGAGSVLAFSMILTLADLPTEVVPVVAAATVIAGLAFVAHPSTCRAKLAPVAPHGPLLFALVVVAAVPLVVYASGQLDLHATSGPHDQHHEFGHWIVMAVYALLIPLVGALAAWKVSGWRFPLWVAGLMSIALGIGSLGITAVSQLSTSWSLLAIGWGAAFIAVGEREGRTHVAGGRPVVEVSMAGGRREEKGAQLTLGGVPAWYGGGAAGRRRARRRRSP
jgi:hypothetical protein